MSKIPQLWVEKYRSKTLDEYVFQNKDQKAILEKIIKNKDIPHLLLTGQAGSGKTTISEILIKMLEIEPSDLLTINASENNGVDYIRDVISSFASTYPMGDVKIIQLEECLDKNTLITVLRQGKECHIEIKSLLPETDLIKSYNIANNGIEYTTFELLNNGLRNDLYELELENGCKVVCTSNHKWFVNDDNKIKIVRTDELFKFNHILSTNYK